MMLHTISKYIFLIFIITTGCSVSNNHNLKKSEYKFHAPNVTLFLPEILHEISGLTLIDANTIACVQDENGYIFMYDIINNKIKEQYTFNYDGDYEGITRVGQKLYVLQSDGILFEITDYTTPDFKIFSYYTGIPADNNEGLCYDVENNRLLIACKGKIGKGPEFKDKRVIYGFDLSTKKLSEEPVYEFNLQVIKQFALEEKVDLPTRTKKKGQITEPIIKFAISAIGIHPITSQLYVLSATDHLIFMFNSLGEIEHIEQLDPEMFNKAEGITFFENGDMLITNEGQDKKPSLLRFNYK